MPAPFQCPEWGSPRPKANCLWASFERFSGIQRRNDGKINGSVDSLQFVAIWMGYSIAQLALFPGLHTQLLSLAVRKAGEGLDGFITWCVRGWCHAQSADVWVCSLPFTFLSLNSVLLSLQFVLQIRLLLDRSRLATVRDVSGVMHHVINPSRPSLAFHTASDKSWVWRPGNEAKHSSADRLTVP